MNTLILVGKTFTWLLFVAGLVATVLGCIAVSSSQSRWKKIWARFGMIFGYITVVTLMYVGLLKEPTPPAPQVAAVAPVPAAIAPPTSTPAGSPNNGAAELTAALAGFTNTVNAQLAAERAESAKQRAEMEKILTASVAKAHEAPAPQDARTINMTAQPVQPPVVVTVNITNTTPAAPLAPATPAVKAAPTIAPAAAPSKSSQSSDKQQQLLTRLEATLDGLAGRVKALENAPSQQDTKAWGTAKDALDVANSALLEVRRTGQNVDGLAELVKQLDGTVSRFSAIMTNPDAQVPVPSAYQSNPTRNSSNQPKVVAAPQKDGDFRFQTTAMPIRVWTGPVFKTVYISYSVVGRMHESTGSLEEAERICKDAIAKFHSQNGGYFAKNANTPGIQGELATKSGDALQDVIRGSGPEFSPLKYYVRYTVSGGNHIPITTK